MRHLKTTLTLGIVPVLAATLLFTSTPAQAASTVYIEVHASTVWPITDAIRFVDNYTASTAYLGACRAGYRCIKVYEKTINTSWSAVTYPGNPTTTIYLNPTRRTYSWSARRSIVTHELGHAYGITYHSAYCTNVMYANVRCPSGSLPTYRFTDPQRVILKAH